MLSVDIPMYVSRWRADEASGRVYLALGQGLNDAWSRRVVTFQLGDETTQFRSFCDRKAGQPTEWIEVTDESRPLYRELVEAGLMMPLHSFASGVWCVDGFAAVGGVSPKRIKSKSMIKIKKRIGSKIEFLPPYEGGIKGGFACWT